jgi:hypothetical protein
MQSIAEGPQAALVDAQSCIRLLFPTEGKPSLRTFREWQARGWIPFRKIGHLVFFDPAEIQFSRYIASRAAEFKSSPTGFGDMMAIPIMSVPGV